MKRKNPSGILIVEAIVASFLMVFAFLASASLYDAALRWETQSGNMRKATMVAERKMEELRAVSAQVPSGKSFADHFDSLIPTSPESIDGFEVTTTVLPNHHEKVKTSGYTPPDGFYSPCSTLYTEPDNPGSTSRNAAPYNFDSGTLFDPAPRGAGDFQLNNLYQTYPYSRTMNKTYRLVKVSVNYGARNGQPVELVSVIGDPILPLKDTSPNPNIDVSMKVTPAGVFGLAGANNFLDFSFTLTAANGSVIEDAACLWSVHPLSSGTGDLFVMDGIGSKVRVRRSDLSRNGSKIILFPRVRYRGVDVRATGSDIQL